MNKAKKIILWSLILCLLLGAAGYGGWLWYDNNIDRSGWREKDGITMYADFHGKSVTGWQEIEGERYYFDETCALETGWLELEEGTYYLDNQGRMQRNWLEATEGRFWLGQDGTVKYEWQEIDGQRCYLGTDGILVTGWQEVEGSRHYFDEAGVLQTGWLELENGVYYLNENGTPATAWLELEDKTYFFDNEGILLTGWQQIDELTYCFGDDGTMVTGWLETDDGTCYFLENGPLATGWQEIEGKHYCFDQNGRMHTGWLEQGDAIYYLHNDGTAAAGPTEIDGKIHYFTPKGIRVLLVNPWHPLADDYRPDLVEIEDGWMVDRQILEPLQAMLADMRTEGLLPYFSSAYRDYDHQQTVWDSYVQQYMEQGYDEETANAMTARYVAVPGTSEHHTGLAVDIVGCDYYYDKAPGSTVAVQKWLAEHCWEYGFILRYTAEKTALTGFAAETWHFRYVGTAVSMDMKDSGLCLEEYLNASGDH